MAPGEFLALSMIRYLIALMIAMLLFAAPMALAQEDPNTPTNDSDPEDKAWVDDCPPDHMCAFDAGEEPATESDEPTYDGNCGGAEPTGEARTNESSSSEVCGYDESHSLGPEGCIECSLPPTQDGEEDYVKAPEGSEGGITSVKEDEVRDAKTVPAAAGALALVGGAIAVALVAARRQG